MFEGLAGTTVDLFLRKNMSTASGKGAMNIKIDGADKVGDKLRVTFPQGSGFVSHQLRISWSK
jgi:hypothetical protein